MFHDLRDGLLQIRQESNRVWMKYFQASIFMPKKMYNQM